MYKKLLPLPLLVAVALLSGILSSCSDSTDLKLQTQQALSKQTEIKNYRFAGSADLRLGFLPSAKDSSPLTNSMFALIKDSKFTWQGVLAQDAERWEADFTLKPKGSTNPFILPIILKDNKLYFHLPIMNIEDEFYSYDLSAQSKKAGNDPSVSDQSISNPAISGALINSLLIGMDAKWFKLQKNEENSELQTIFVSITAKNEQEATEALQLGLAELLQNLAASGFVSAETAKKLNPSTQGVQIAVGSPGYISIATDERGFIRQQQISLRLITTDAIGRTAENTIELQQTFDEINEQPLFAKSIPEKSRSFEEVLNLLAKLPK